MYIEVMKAIPLSISTLIGIVWRPILASGAMALVLRLHPFAHIEPAFLRLLLEIVTGAGCFTFALFALWLLAGRPEGGERTAIEQLGQILRSRK
jgi:hypothetical protein